MKPHVVMLGKENRFDEKPGIHLQQTHSANVVVLASPHPQTVLQADGVITNCTNSTLWVKTADCMPILLSHPSGVVATLHAGRKGTQQQILRKTLIMLQTKFAIEDQLSAWFGPHICEKCYQVERATDTHYSLLKENTKQLYSVFEPKQVDLTVHPDCTLCQNNKWYSYRAGERGVSNYFGITNNN